MKDRSVKTDSETHDNLPSRIPLRAGIAGAGLMGYWHAWAVKRTGGSVSAVMDIDQEAAKRLAKSHSCAKTFSDVEQMLNSVKLDVLHICTPPSTHYRIAELAIAAGINLLIDKPIAPTVADTERLFNRAENLGVLICPVHQFIFQDGVLKARKSLPRIGQLIHMEVTLCSAGGAGLASAGTTDKTPLDEIAADILPHPLSLMHVFLPNGLPEENWMTVRPGHGEFRAVCEISGITLSVFISMHARPTECSFKIIGTDGTIHIDMFHGYSFIEPGKVSRLRKATHPFDLSIRRLSAAAFNLGRRLIRWEPAYPGLEQLVGSFYKAVQTGTESLISREDTIRVARVRDILIQNAGPFKPEQPNFA